MADVVDHGFASDIEELEARIETLAAAIERCRKISLAGKIAAGGGALWLALILTGIVTFSPAMLLAALAAIIGGVVALGSNKTTWEETAAALAQVEALRAQKIGQMQLRLVGEHRTLH